MVTERTTTAKCVGLTRVERCARGMPKVRRSRQMHPKLAAWGSTNDFRADIQSNAKCVLLLSTIIFRISHVLKFRLVRPCVTFLTLLTLMALFRTRQTHSNRFPHCVLQPMFIIIIKHVRECHYDHSTHSHSPD